MVRCPTCWKKHTAREMDFAGLSLRGYDANERAAYFCSACRTLLLMRISQFVTIPKEEGDGSSPKE